MYLLLFFLMIVVAVVLAVRLYLRAVVLRRTAYLVERAETEDFRAEDGVREGGWLVNWLASAGYRRPSARFIFITATAGIAALGLMLILLMNRLGVIDTMVATLSDIPGGMGDVLASVASTAPYFILTVCVLAPALVVRAARRSRVAAVEQDLAASLELFATLAEAGLGFDAGMARIQESEDVRRPLSQEFHIYQRDVLGGIPRVTALRNLAQRTGVTSVSIFVSALIQAEQVGASLAETLRTQADDLRDRRKLQALLLAQALPVKLVFPLMACFLPGIFFSTLGPVISQFVDVADSVLRK